MINAPLPRALPSGSGRLSMIIPQNHGLTITYSILNILTIVFPGTRTEEYQPTFHGVTKLFYACCVVIDYH